MNKISQGYSFSRPTVLLLRLSGCIILAVGDKVLCNGRFRISVAVATISQ